jgi:hypothetical protein
MTTRRVELSPAAPGYEPMKVVDVPCYWLLRARQWVA